MGGLSPRLWRARLAGAYIGVWGDAQWGPGAKPLVRGSGGQSPPEAEFFLVNESYISAGKELPLPPKVTSVFCYRN